MTPAEVKAVVAESYGLTQNTMWQPRAEIPARARYVAMYILSTRFGMKNTAIARELNTTDSLVRHGLKRVEHLVSVDKSTQRRIAALNKRVRKKR